MPVCPLLWEEECHLGAVVAVGVWSEEEPQGCCCNPAILLNFHSNSAGQTVRLRRNRAENLMQKEWKCGFELWQLLSRALMRFRVRETLGCSPGLDSWEWLGKTVTTRLFGEMEVNFIIYFMTISSWIPILYGPKYVPYSEGAFYLYVFTCRRSGCTRVIVRVWDPLDVGGMLPSFVSCGHGSLKTERELSERMDRFSSELWGFGGLEIESEIRA